MNGLYVAILFVSLFSMYLQNKEWSHFTPDGKISSRHFEITKNASCPKLKPCYTLLKYDVRYRCGSDDMCVYGHKCCRSDCYVHRVCVATLDEDENKGPTTTPKTQEKPLQSTRKQVLVTESQNLESSFGVQTSRTTRSLLDASPDFASKGDVSATIGLSSMPSKETSSHPKLFYKKKTTRAAFHSNRLDSIRKGAKQNIDKLDTVAFAEKLVSKHLEDTFSDKSTKKMNKISEKTSYTEDPSTTPIYIFIDDTGFENVSVDDKRLNLTNSSDLPDSTEEYNEFDNENKPKKSIFETNGSGDNNVESSVTASSIPSQFIKQKYYDSDIEFSGSGEGDTEFSGSGGDMEYSGSGDDMEINKRDKKHQGTFRKSSTKEYTESFVTDNQRTSTTVPENTATLLGGDGVDKTVSSSDKNEIDASFTKPFVNESKEYGQSNNAHSMTIDEKIKNETNNVQGQNKPKETNKRDEDVRPLTTTPSTLARATLDISLDEVISGSGDFEDGEFSGHSEYKGKFSQIDEEYSGSGNFDHSGSGNYRDDDEDIPKMTTLRSDNDSDLVFSEYDDSFSGNGFSTKTVTNFTPKPSEPLVSSAIKTHGELDKNSTIVSRETFSKNQGDGELDTGRNSPSEEAKKNWKRKKSTISVGHKEGRKNAAKEMLDMLKESSYTDAEDNNYYDD